MDKDKLATLITGAQENLRKDGELVPVVFLEQEHETIGVAFHMPPGDRHWFFTSMGKIFAAKYPDLKSVTLLADAYTKMWDTEKYSSEEVLEEATKRRLVDDPESVECINAIQVNADGTSIDAVCIYTRNVELKSTTFEFEEIKFHEQETTPQPNLLVSFWEGYRS